MHLHLEYFVLQSLHCLFIVDFWGSIVNFPNLLSPYHYDVLYPFQALSYLHTQNYWGAGGEIPIDGVKGLNAGVAMKYPAGIVEALDIERELLANTKDEFGAFEGEVDVLLRGNHE